MENKICLVTGANSGIGKETVKTLVKMGAFVDELTEELWQRSEALTGLN